MKSFSGTFLCLTIPRQRHLFHVIQGKKKRENAQKQITADAEAVLAADEKATDEKATDERVPNLLDSKDEDVIF